ncbi:MAG: 3-deoxy-manno-octulosonate cytidylyltransferase [Myxococcales bacterium]|nr:3-deoxy-manno-octulosonate cytidylyltransferase [Myxococcales bacterium]
MNARASVKVLAVIPVRYASTRLPAKPLADIHGRPMVQWVYEAAAGAEGVDELVVATDDERIARAVRAFGGAVEMTAASHRNGSERVAEVARRRDADVVVNVQGDEPAVDPRGIERAVAALRDSPGVRMSTLRVRLEDPAAIASPNVVKVVTDLAGDALYFSRSPIPFCVDAPTPCYKHLGLYAYRRDLLLEMVAWPPTALELAERLEQLRALEHGVRIRVVDAERDSIGVDTAEDLERVRALLAGARKSGRKEDAHEV